MPSERRSVYPFDLDGAASALTEFARLALGSLGGLESFPLVSETSASEPYDFSERRQRFGRVETGYELVDRTDYYEGGGWLGERQSLFVRAYGLPEGAGLVLSAGGRSLDLELSAGDDALLQSLLASFDQRFQLAPSQELLDRLESDAHGHLGRQRWEAARTAGEAVLVHRPRSKDALLAVGVSSAALGDPERAERVLGELVALAPDHVDARYNLGNLAFDRGDFAAAESAFRRVLATDPTNHPACFQLAATLERAGRLGEALAAYRQTIETSPNPGGAWGYRGLDFTARAEEAVGRLSGRA